jgi:hypothetical protein
MEGDLRVTAKSSFCTVRTDVAVFSGTVLSARSVFCLLFFIIREVSI